ncbi:glycosyltransferase family 39 protein [Candidatus Woesearchaeota archaeon]|nr:glycosyltransferase family 39 protein [Candidatus Woesearchaeota archaeon]
MGFLLKVKNIFLKNKNQIYLALFLNYMVLFSFEIGNLSYRSFQPGENLAIFRFFLELSRYMVYNGLLLQFALLLMSAAVYLAFTCFISAVIVNAVSRTINKYPKLINCLKSKYFLIIFLIVFSGFIRFSFLNGGLFHHDSFQIAIAAEKTLEDWNLHGIGGGRHGIVIVDSIIFYFFKMVMGHESAEFAVNFGSALFGTLSIPILYLLLENLFENRFIAFSSGILYSVSPIFLSVSTFAKEHTLDVFVVLLSLLSLILGLKKANYALIFISGMLSSLLIFIRFPSLLAVFSALFLIIGFTQAEENLHSRNKIKKMLAYLAPILILSSLYLVFESETLSNEVKSNFRAMPSGIFGPVLISALAYSVDTLVVSLTAAGLLLSIIGFVLLFMKKRRLFYFLVIFSIPLIIFYALSKTVSHRFFAVPVIAFIVALCYLIYLVVQREPYAGALILILLVSSSFFSIYPVIKFRHEFSAFKDLAKMVNDNTNPEDSIVILYGDDTIALNYYSKTPTKSCDFNPDVISIKSFAAQLNSLLNRGLKVYISGGCFGIGNQEEQALFLGIMGSNFKGSIVAEYTSDDYHRGAVKPIVKKISMLRLYSKKSQKHELESLEIKY